MRNITPHLWFDKEAAEAAVFYCSVFSNSRITGITTIHEVPSPTGDSDIVSFELRGLPFMAINAGPLFTFNPSVSFLVNYDPSREREASENIDAAWEMLLPGGTVLMPLQEYPWSRRYGWIKDKYGLSWQVTPTIMAEMMAKGTPEQVARVTRAFLPMKKFDLGALQKAYEGP
ncbi:MAG: hypothetical protein EPN93_18705 [Spirochaetes bacterium]|nr:MAG: hypothetical protein EPN93_18705 [Spirochaetota bacterium]